MAKTSMFVKLSAQDGKRDDLLAALNKMLGAVNEEEGTEIYAFNLDDTDENALWIYELYSDADALASHSASDRHIILSVTMCFPAFAAATASVAWVLLGVASTTRSISGSAKAASGDS